MVRLPFPIESLAKLRNTGSRSNRLMLLGFVIFSGITLRSMRESSARVRREKGEELLDAIKQVGGSDQATIDRMAEIMNVKPKTS
mmetsp:Transcript_3089/g.6394  ORF Transcript_3089/g.6394 Transcript_3089/m.6394 type:complete len:85 (-) Transcript_3089:964-1218(-)